jgi:hypothetical protein
VSGKTSNLKRAYGSNSTSQISAMQATWLKAQETRFNLSEL